MLSLGYVVNAFAAWYLFGEALSLQRMVGIAIILVGVVVLARARRRQALNRFLPVTASSLLPLRAGTGMPGW